MRAYALVGLGDSESIDLFLREEDARRALEDILSDEPDWAGLSYVCRSNWTRRPAGLAHAHLPTRSGTPTTPLRGLMKAQHLIQATPTLT